MNDKLYKRGYSQPYLRCIEEEEAKYVLEETHGGVCRDHMRAKSLVRKIMRTGYFWPTMQQDAAEFVKKCDSCQRYENVQQVPGEQMTTISLPWSFAQWGIDIMGPPATRKETDEIPAHRNLLLHKVGGSRSSCNNHRNKGTKFCMEKHCL